MTYGKNYIPVEKNNAHHGEYSGRVTCIESAFIENRSRSEILQIMFRATFFRNTKKRRIAGSRNIFSYMIICNMRENTAC